MHCFDLVFASCGHATTRAVEIIFFFDSVRHRFVDNCFFCIVSFIYKLFFIYSMFSQCKSNVNAKQCKFKSNHNEEVIFCKSKISLKLYNVALKSGHMHHCTNDTRKVETLRCLQLYYCR